MDRTKVLHGPRTQTYGETNYLKKLSFGQNQSIAWSSDSNLWGNQLIKKAKFWTEPRYCMVFCSVLQDDYILKIGLRPRRNEGPNLSSDPQF